mmetsp:Transcript_44231/g.94157  ORF Transcript_44231/g.94157 Transcript_44231/m.94157 type:complete len:178 (+) Transcript_44231:130-663(+)
MADSTPLIAIDGGGAKEEKIGHKICGCCCDSRRAVIVLNVINIILTVIGMSIVVFANNSPDLDKALVEQGISVEDWEKSYKIFMAVYSIDIVILTIVALGANLYNICSVGLGLIWALAYMTFSIWANGSNSTAVTIAGAAISFLIKLYIYGVFISEVKDGIMTPETYPREEFSCCCA